MSAEFIPSVSDLQRFLPEMILILAATLLLVLEVLTVSKRSLAAIALVSLVAAMIAAAAAQLHPGPAFQKMLVVDGFANFFRVLTIAAGVLVVLCSGHYLRRESAQSGEYYALVLYSISGQCLMVSANELIILFIGLEVSSIASYVLAGYLRDDRRNNESALKYFLLGSFASSFLLYGIAWIYGLTGTTILPEIAGKLTGPQAPSFMLVGSAAALMFVGLAFKVAAVPFQAWAPDVYQGAPAPVSAFLSAGPKAAAFAALLRISITAFGPLNAEWEPALWLSALATMIVGNFAALRQTNIKRMLAYSSIAHAGYVMVALTANSAVGTAAAMFYLAVYALMNIGAFAVVVHVAQRGEQFVEIDDFAGLGRRQPATAALLTIFLLSLIGVPLTGGFFGKFYIFKAALDSQLLWLTVLGLLSSAVAAYYYLRVMVVMYMQESDSEQPLPAPSPGLRTALWLSAAGTLLLGVFPSALLEFATRSAVLGR